MRRLAILLLLGWSLAGCTRTVSMDEPTLTGAPAETCSPLMAALPDRVLDAERRTVEPGRTGAAWGDPTITLRCGVGQPTGVDAVSSCLSVNGVDWYVQQGDTGTVFTTYGRAVGVQVAVPQDYSPAAGALTFVADAIKAHDPQQQACQ